jgi:hypothetical protein
MQHFQKVLDPKPVIVAQNASIFKQEFFPKEKKVIFENIFIRFF